MEHRENAQWRRVHGSRAIWTVSRKRRSLRDDLRQLAWSWTAPIRVGARILRRLIAEALRIGRAARHRRSRAHA